jgi:hypothetical protein
LPVVHRKLEDLATVGRSNQREFDVIRASHFSDPGVDGGSGFFEGGAQRIGCAGSYFERKKTTQPKHFAAEPKPTPRGRTGVCCNPIGGALQVKWEPVAA